MSEQPDQEKEDMMDSPGNVARDTPSDSSSSTDTDDEDYILLKKLANMDFADRPQELHKGTAFAYHDVFAQHACTWDPNYPENPQRVLEPLRRCRELGLVQRCKPGEPSYASLDVLLSKHSRELVELAETTAVMSEHEHKEVSQRYDSWYCNKHTYEAALASAGSIVSMTEDIMAGKVTNGFAMVRPPGHHAQESEFNGYCTFNNVALAAQAALDAGLNKVMIVDWDVHHGQGIQQMFYDDPRVLYFSIHRYEYGHFWPWLRESDYDYIGSDKGKGFNVNIPLNKIGMTNADYLSILHQVILPIAYEFSPQLVLVGSGYDAALGCPEGEMLLTPAMYAHMTHHMTALATGRVCVALEGGYCIESLAEGCALTLRALLKDPCPRLADTGEPSDSVTSTILNVVKVLKRHWECFSHYKTTGRSQLCPFEEVNNMPPVSHVEFSTPENRPAKFDLDTYPSQEKEEKNRISAMVQALVEETDLSTAETKCCYVFDADMRAHKLENHPEQPDRISAIYNRLAEGKLLKRLLQVPSRLARKSELLWIHTEDYIQDLVTTQTMEEADLQYVVPMQRRYNSVYMNQKSLHCALLSCGSFLNLVEAILTNQAQSGVAIVRPPGHHAECSKAMGFCFFNNVAVGARLAQHKFGIKRILILDWDIHHGNATQHQFYDDPSVLYVSLHRFDNGWFFPGSQDANFDRCGEGAGLGYNINIPWQGGRMGDAEYISAFTQVVMPIAYQFDPELVLVSAGFDAAIGDPLGGYKVTPGAYGHMTHMLMGLANGRVALALEGGYHLTSISEAMAVCTSVLLGEPCPMLGPLVAVPGAMTVIGEVMETQKQYWSCLKSKVMVPSTRQVEAQRWEREKSALDARLENRCNKPKDVDAARISSATPTTAAGDAPDTKPLDDDADTNSTSSPGSNSAAAAVTVLGVTAVTRGVASLSVTSRPATAPPTGMGRPLTEEPSLTQSSEGFTTPRGRIPEGTRAPQPVTVGGEQVKLGARPKVVAPDFRPPVTASFRSVLYADEPDMDPLSIFTSCGKMADNGAISQQKPAAINPSRASYGANSNGAGSGSANTTTAVADAASGGDDGVVGGAVGGGGGAVGGACGGGRPNTVEEFLQMQGAQQMYAVTPLPWCPHLTEVRPLPTEGLDSQAPCATCGDTSENWVCLTCYSVQCSRFVNEHMLFHRLETEHNLVLSYSDISVWCYACDQYVDNEVLKPAKNAAHKSKFGEPLPGMN